MNVAKQRLVEDAEWFEACAADFERRSKEYKELAERCRKAAGIDPQSTTEPK